MLMTYKLVVVLNATLTSVGDQRERLLGLALFNSHSHLLPTTKSVRFFSGSPVCTFRVSAFILQFYYSDFHEYQIKFTGN